MKKLKIRYTLSNLKNFMPLALLLSICACNEDYQKLSDVAIFATPGADEQVILHPDEQELYEISVLTPNQYISQVKVITFDAINGLQEVMAWQGSRAEETFQWVYKAPTFKKDTTQVSITIEAADNLGNRASIKRFVTVVNKAVSMDELTGIVMYMPQSGLSDALSLNDVTQPFSLALDAGRADEADVYCDTIPDSSPLVINWRTNTQTRFVRYNSFNYATATPTGIQDVYQSSMLVNHIDNIKVNDVIIVGHGSRAQGVFFVANIAQSQGNAFMQLSYKGIMGSSL